MVEIKEDTSEFDELLLDVLYACCGENDEIDNRCLSAYEDACRYLSEKGYLVKKNDRIYELTKKWDT